MSTIAKKLAQVKPGALLAGVDWGLDSVTVVVLEAGGQRVDRFKAPQSRDGYEYLRQRLQRLVEQQAASGLLVGMEPTNYYWKHMGAYLNQQHLPFRRVNPYTVKRHREGDQLDKAKDDWRDAFMIADLLRTGKFNETQLRTGPYAELQIGYATYWRLRHDRGRRLAVLDADDWDGLIEWPRPGRPAHYPSGPGSSASRPGGFRRASAGGRSLVQKSNRAV